MKYPILKQNYMLLKQYELSCLYPLYKETDYGLILSSSFEYDRINKTAAEILELCSGLYTEKEIANLLLERYDEDIDAITTMVSDFLKEAYNKGLIKLMDEKKLENINVSGSFETIFPFNAAIELTKACPLNCKHCFNNSGFMKKDEMTLDEVFIVLQKLTDMGVQKIMLTGGEPLAKKDFVKILEKACDLFLAISIGSNGFLIDKEFIDRIKHFNKKIVFQISVDGLEENHDNIRGVKGSFKKAINAVRILSEANIPVIISSTLNKLNIDDMEGITSLVKTMGAKQITYSNTMEVGRAKGKGLNDGFDYKYLISKSLDMAQKYADRNFYVNVHDLNEEERANKCVTCGNGDTQITVRGNGDVSPCIHFPLVYGNLVKEEPVDIFNKDRVLGFRKVVQPSKECFNCMKCNGCVAYAVQMDKKDCEWKRNNGEYMGFINQFSFTD